MHHKCGLYQVTYNVWHTLKQSKQTANLQGNKIEKMYNYTELVSRHVKQGILDNDRSTP